MSLLRRRPLDLIVRQDAELILSLLKDDPAVSTVAAIWSVLRQAQDEDRRRVLGQAAANRRAGRQVRFRRGSPASSARSVDSPSVAIVSI